MREKWGRKRGKMKHREGEKGERESGRWRLELAVWAFTKCENGRRSEGKDGRIRGGRQTLAPEKELKCEEDGERGEMKGKIRCYCSQR